MFFLNLSYSKQNRLKFSGTIMLIYTLYTGMYLLHQQCYRLPPRGV